MNYIYETKLMDFDPEKLYPKKINENKWRLDYCLDLLYALTEKGGTKSEIQNVLKYAKVVVHDGDVDQAFRDFDIDLLYKKYIQQIFVVPSE